MLVQLESEWKEALYKWNGKNEELVVETNVATGILQFCRRYEEDSGFFGVQQKAR